jgi:four helix bundle protein
MEYYYEKLEVWQKARNVVKLIYQETEKFPNSELFGLSIQMRRAAVSVASNIAEGSCRTSEKDKSRFYEISYGSVVELRVQATLAHDLKYLSDENLNLLIQEFDQIARMLSGLRRRTINRGKSSPQ